MTELAQKSHLKEIEHIVEHLMEDWMTHKFKHMDRYFSNHVVMIETGTHQRITGVNSVLEQYQLFMEDAEVLEYNITELLIDLMENTAVAYITYRLKYEVKSTTYNESNMEILVFHATDEQWKIMWRTQMIGA